LQICRIIVIYTIENLVENPLIIKKETFIMFFWISTSLIKKYV